MKEWDSYSPFNSDDGGDEWNADELPDCEQGGNGYIGLGCNSDGTFSINHYQDQYCLSSTGVYDTLCNLNYKLKSYKSCRALDSTDDGDSQLATTLMYYTESCSNLDSGSSSKSARSRSTKRSKSRPREEEGGVFT